MSSTRDHPCQICGGHVSAYRHFWLSRCDRCRVLSSTLPVEIPAVEDPAGINEARRYTGLEPLRLMNNSKMLAAIGRHAPPGARLLDVGCGPGMLLRQAMAAGFSPEGIEPDANILRVARGSTVPVRHGYFPEGIAANETFDVIVFNDVLEHIGDLRGVLEAAQRHLTPTGILCLNCPDQRGLFYRTASFLDWMGFSGPFERLWQRDMPSPHLWYFTPALLAHAAENAGFQLVQNVRLAPIALRGLWDRIRYVDNTPLLTAVGAYAFSVATYPLASIMTDATACIFRRP